MAGGTIKHNFSRMLSILISGGGEVLGVGMGTLIMAVMRALCRGSMHTILLIVGENWEVVLG